MPQIFQVLRCYKCFIFQIHQTKKSNRWQCKLCGEKQSIKRHYGIGTGKDCRMHVQKLNLMQAEKYSPPDISSETDSNDETSDMKQDTSHINTERKNKWSNYIVENEAIQKPIVLNNINLEGKENKIKASQLQSSSKNNNNSEDDQYTEELSTINSLLSNSIEVHGSKNEVKLMNGPGPSKHFDEINLCSKWANYVELSKENCYQDSGKTQNDHKEAQLETDIEKLKRYKFSCSGTSRSSKWVNFIESECNNIIKHNLENDSHKQKEYVNTTQRQLSPYNHTSAVAYSELNNPQNIKQHKLCTKESLFSMSDEQDLDSILDI